jgi:metal-responsive CopG/Arc/MetJ family transcriptional regulator
MKTIQMTLQEPLLEQVNEVVKELGMTRSAFIRNALQQALQQFETAKLERKHRAGYARYPVQPGEFDLWEAEQSWHDV